MKTVQISENAHARLFELRCAWRLKTNAQTVDKLFEKLDEQAQKIGEMKSK